MFMFTLSWLVTKIPISSNPQSDEMMPDFSNMTEEEQIAFAMQMSMQDAREWP